MTDSPCFIYDDNGMYINQTCYFIPRDDKYLCAVLNSRLIYFYMKQIASGLGNGALRWIKQFIENLPIPQITESNKPLCDEIIQCVEQILSLRGSGNSHNEAIHKDKAQNADSSVKVDCHDLQSKSRNDSKTTAELESKIDSLVYTLYNLSDDEIATIES